MLVLPEGETGFDKEVQVEALPCKEKILRDSWLQRSGLRRPVLIWLLASCAVAVAFLVVGLLVIFMPGFRTEGATYVLVLATAAIFLVVALPMTVGLSAAIVWGLLGRRGECKGGQFGRSVLAVTSGVLTLAAAGLLVLALRSWLPSGVPPVVDWTSDVIAGICAGWVTVRLSPSAPYRHALGVCLVLVTGVFLFALAACISSGQALWVPLASAVYLLFLPVLMLGAWIGARREASMGPPEPA